MAVFVVCAFTYKIYNVPGILSWGTSECVTRLTHTFSFLADMNPHFQIFILEVWRMVRTLSFKLGEQNRTPRSCDLFHLSLSGERGLLENNPTNQVLGVAQ